MFITASAETPQAILAITNQTETIRVNKGKMVSSGLEKTLRLNRRN